MLSFFERKETTFLGKVSNICTAYIFLVIWTTLVVIFYNWLFAVESAFFFPGFGQITNQLFQYKHPFLINLFLSCIIAPLWEEAFFRHLPLQIVKQTKKELLLPVLFGTSMIFGFVHDGGQSIPIQGVAGITLAIVYVKNNYSYWSSVALHAMWNLSMLLGVFTFLK